MEAAIYRGSSPVVKGIPISQTFWSRFKGLLGKKHFTAGEGMLLRPCCQVHTFFMAFAIDVVFLDKKGEIVELVANLIPGRLSPLYLKSYQVLELPTGTIEEKFLQKGDVLEILEQE